MKACCICREVTDQFCKNSSHKDGFESRCKPCAAKAHREWYAKNKTHVTAWLKNYLSTHPNLVRHLKEMKRISKAAWGKRNPEKTNEYRRRWIKKNPQKRAAWQAIYKAIEIQAMPEWSEVAEIAYVYERSRHLSKMYDRKFTVDHVVPLRSTLVCGLHVWANLQLLDGSLNSQKKNNEWPDMPGMQ